MYSIKPITETSWILTKDGEKTAVITQTEKGVSVLGSVPKKKHETLNDLIQYLGNDVTIEAPTQQEIEKEAAEINGFPIKHDVCYDVQNEPIANYTRTKNSSIKYAAGYFALKFKHGWTASFCPKLSTLAEYEYLGPFKSKLEMQNSISQKNNSSNV
jgi:hypothetical protein